MSNRNDPLGLGIDVRGIGRQVRDIGRTAQEIDRTRGTVEASINGSYGNQEKYRAGGRAYREEARYYQERGRAEGARDAYRGSYPAGQGPDQQYGGAQWGAPQRGGYGSPQYNPAYGPQPQQSRGGDPRAEFIQRVIAAHRSQNPQELQDAIEFGNSLERNGVIQMGRMDIPTARGNGIRYNGEAKSAEQFAFDVGNILQQQGNGRPFAPDLYRGSHVPAPSYDPAPQAPGSGNVKYPSDAELQKVVDAFAGAANSTEPQKSVFLRELEKSFNDIKSPDGQYHLERGGKVSLNGKEFLIPPKVYTRDELAKTMADGLGIRQPQLTGPQAPGTAPSTTPEVKPSEIPAGKTGEAKVYGLKPVKKDEMPDGVNGREKWLQQKLKEANQYSLPVDGKYGIVTHTGGKAIAEKAGVKYSDVDFDKPDNAATKAFMKTLDEEIAKAKGVTQPAPAPQVKQPSPEEIARQQAAAAAAAAAAERARREADEREGPLAGTAYDSRNLPRDYEGRYKLARQTLLGMRELHDEDKRHSNENMHDKMKEAVEKANEYYPNLDLQIPSERNPFTNDAMTALGLVAVREGHLNRDMGAVAYGQSSANRAADKLLDKLHIRGETQAERIAQVERWANLPDDGRADPEMIRAAQAMYAQKVALGSVGVTGGQTVAGDPSGPVVQSDPQAVAAQRQQSGPGQG